MLSKTKQIQSNTNKNKKKKNNNNQQPTTTNNNQQPTTNNQHRGSTSGTPTWRHGSSNSSGTIVVSRSNSVTVESLGGGWRPKNWWFRKTPQKIPQYSGGVYSSLGSILNWWIFTLHDILPYECSTPAKFNSSPLKNDGWKITFHFGMVNFQGRAVKLRGSI